MSILSKVLGIFSKNYSTFDRHEPYGPGVSVFPEIDIEKVKKNLGLKKRGKEQGSINIPSPESNSFDQVENDIFDFVNREKDRAYEIAINNYNGYYERYRHLQDSTSINKIETIKKNTIVTINSINNSVEDLNLFGLKKEMVKLGAELNRFKKENKLNREPFYPKSKVLSFSIIFIIFVFESVLNGVFFARGHEFGILGGITISILISVVNIFLIGIVFGWLFSRELLHVKWYRQSFGYLFAFITIIICPLFNLFVAHYRAVFATGQKSAEVIALNNIINNPLRLPDIESYFLMIVGCSFCLFTIVKLWKTYENYPGYEALHRKINELQPEYANQKLNMLEELKSATDDGINQMEKALKVIDSNHQSIPAMVTRMHGLREQYEKYMDTLEQLGRTLLSTYRDENSRFRTKEIPSYWSNDWKLSRTDSASLAINKNDFSISDLESIRKDARKLIKEVYKTYQVAFNKIQTLNDLETE